MNHLIRRLSCIIIGTPPHTILLQHKLQENQLHFSLMEIFESVDEVPGRMPELQPMIVFLPSDTDFMPLSFISCLSNVEMITYSEGTANDVSMPARIMEHIVFPPTIESLEDIYLKYLRRHPLPDPFWAVGDGRKPVRTPRTIAVNSMNGIEFLKTNEIMRLEASNTYTTIYMEDGSKLTVARTLKDISSLLSGATFIRVHHSFLINLAFVKRFIKSEGGAVLMHDMVKVPVSRNRKDELLVQLQKFFNMQ